MSIMNQDAKIRAQHALVEAANRPAPKAAIVITVDDLDRVTMNIQADLYQSCLMLKTLDWHLNQIWRTQVAPQ